MKWKNKIKIKILTDSKRVCLLACPNRGWSLWQARVTPSPSATLGSAWGGPGGPGQDWAAPRTPREPESGAHELVDGRVAGAGLPSPRHQSWASGVFWGAGGCVGRETRIEGRRQSDPWNSLTPSTPTFAFSDHPHPCPLLQCPGSGPAMPSPLTGEACHSLPPQEEGPGSPAMR